MNDLDLLERLRTDVEPLSADSRERIRSLIDARIGSIAAETTPGRGSSWTTPIRRRAGRIAIVAVAAVLVGAAAASGFADRLWTNDQPIAIPIASAHASDSFSPDIPHPGDAVSREDFQATISEFAPAIRLPEGGSFGEWTHYIETYWQRGSGLENNRAAVVGSMTRVASCQWMQQWLTATSTSTSNDAAAAQAIRVLPGIEAWQRASGMVVDPGNADSLVGWMRDGNVAQVQLAEDQCAFTGSWGDTVAEQDAKATGDLVPAIEAVRASLRDGGEASDFDWQTGDSVAPAINWTDAKTQPAPLFPGYIYIAPTTQDGVMLIATSESGTRFCAVVASTTLEQGTVDPERFPPDPDSINTPFDTYPGPVACSPGVWPS